MINSKSNSNNGTDPSDSKMSNAQIKEAERLEREKKRADLVPKEGTKEHALYMKAQLEDESKIMCRRLTIDIESIIREKSKSQEQIQKELDIE